MPTRPPVFRPANAPDYQQQRGNARQQGYITRWDRLSRQHRRANPLCVGCEAVGRTTLAQCVDHIVPHKGDYARMWDVGNLQSLCRWHHDTVKQKLEQLHASGNITDADLHMASPKAVELTKALRAEMTGGASNFPETRPFWERRADLCAFSRNRRIFF
jgi:5-methylcytosine-specific restriction enzyme A